MNETPPYQRESDVWSLDKQQLFIDSLLNGFDIPKIYLHDLRGQHPTKVYAVVDGNQRLTTIWRFLADEFPIAESFRAENAHLPQAPPSTTPPEGGMYFSQFDPFWQEVLKTTFLSVVLIQDATMEDIEELFSRLNNGEPLNAAEKRNAMGGDMARLIREVAGRPFFTRRLPFANRRYDHFDLAARLLLIEQTYLDSGDRMVSLTSSALDSFVQANRHLSASQSATLLNRLDRQLRLMGDVFVEADPLLSSTLDPPLYYRFVTSVLAKSGCGWRLGELRDFLEWFQTARRADLDKPDEPRDAKLIEFSRLVQEGTHDRANLERRAQILTYYFHHRWPSRRAAGVR